MELFITYLLCGCAGLLILIALMVADMRQMMKQQQDDKVRDKEQSV
jgi:hypothetical protein